MDTTVQPNPGKPGSEPAATTQAALPATAGGNPSRWRRPLTRLIVAAGILLLCFAQPLFALANYARHSDFFSYIPLMPLITGYLIWIRREKLTAEIRPNWLGAAALSACGAALLAAYEWAERHSGAPTEETSLAAMTGALLLLLAAAGFATLGSGQMRAMAFPVAMLAFMVPYPSGVLAGIENFFQHTSAATASAMLHLAGTTAFRDNLLLTLPDVPPFAGHPLGGLTLEVAPECSGIHSTQVLLITSLLAGNLFLLSPWRRTALALFILPLAILRNGFRIFTLGELCVHINGTMIDSPIHHRGGPIFFALSLIPFFIFLVWLRKGELRRGDAVK